MSTLGQVATNEAVEPRPSRRRRRFGEGNDLRVALLFVAPAALGFGVFFLWPTLRALYLSLTDYNLLGVANFIGLENYRAIAQDPLFWNAMKVTVQYVVINIGLQTVLALALAVLIHRLTRSAAIRGVILLPFVISNVVVALLWFWLLDFQIGIVNQMIEWVGMARIPFFGSEAWAIPTIAFINVWRHLGYTALLIFAGLQTIPPVMYEAGATDGASEWKMFWKITMPLLRPVLALVLVITVVGSFQVFDTVAVTTDGGPVHATRVIQLYIVERAFERSDFGYASALSIILMLVLAGVAYVQMRMLRAGDSDLN